MNLQTNSPRTNVGRHLAILMVSMLFSFSAAMQAQQSSSSSANLSTKPKPAAALSRNRHFTLEGSAGGAMTSGLQTGQYMTSGFTGMVGAGYRLNPKFSIFLEGNYYHSSMPAAVLQTARQNSGNYNIFTITGDPMFHLYQGQKYGFYAIGGGGFSQVSTAFGKPITSINCNIYSGLGYAYFTNFCNGKITGSSYSTTQALYDFGLGMDVHLFPSRRESLFVESRYVHIMTPSNQLPGPNIGLVPISGGLRW